MSLQQNEMLILTRSETKRVRNGLIKFLVSFTLGITHRVAFGEFKNLLKMFVTALDTCYIIEALSIIQP